MKQLLGLDAAFLYLETANAPMHIGGLLLLEPGNGAESFDFAVLRDFMASRLHVSRIFRQRLVHDPLHLGSPHWIEDEHFDLDNHLTRTRLAEPGGWAQLAALVAFELSQPLNRERPLWEMLYVDGLEAIPEVPAGTLAMISKIHHAAIDGGSGAEILGALFDLSPEPRPRPEAIPWKPETVPSDLELLARTGRNIAAKPYALAGAVGRTMKGVAGMGAAWALKRIKPPPSPFTAPRTRLNVPVDKDRVWAGQRFALSRIKEIKQAVDGATVNDVVLAICAGALRDYLLAVDDLPARPLIAMAPVSVRAEGERGAMGNRVSAMLVSLATDEADPMKRLIAIHDSALRSKVHQKAIGADTLTDYTEFVPFNVAALATRLYTSMGGAKLHRPVFNVVITNVPGPQEPLYMAGARLLAHYGMGPILDGMGLFMPVLSYAGSLTISAVSCRSILPDIARLTAGLETALSELEAAAGT